MTFKVVGSGSPNIESHPQGRRRRVMTKEDNDWPGNHFRLWGDCASAVGAGGRRDEGQQDGPGDAREGAKIDVYVSRFGTAAGTRFACPAEGIRPPPRMVVLSLAQLKAR